MGNAYNPRERYLAKILSKFPGVKSRVKRGYQTLNLLLYKKNYTNKSVKPVYPVSADTETFFGYYDKSPLSEDNRYLLYNSTDQPTNKLPSALKPIGINVVDLQESKIVHSSKSLSYNWQQGARAQWLTPATFIYNNYDDDRGYHSLIVDVNKNRSRLIDQPVYDCFKDEYALTLNFNRLMALRPDYGYRNKAIIHDNDIDNLTTDGIFTVDLANNTSSLIIDLQTLRDFDTDANMKNARHKVNHIMISPDGGHFIFLHRYFLNKRRFDRLFVADKQGQNLKLLAADDMVSHCAWIDNKNIVGYLRDAALGDKYYKINIETGKKEIIGKGIIEGFGDGHPSVYKNKMVFDTYPNKARMKELFMFDLDTQELDKLGEFYEGLKYTGENRCDLHPRFSFDGTKVFFDSVHTGKRSLCWMEV